MADLQRTIEIIFNGVDDVSGTLTTISGKMSKFGDTVSEIGDPFANLAKGIGAVDVALGLMAAAALTARSAIESETNKMSNALGLPTAEAEKFADVAKNVYTAGFGENLSDAFAMATIAAGKFKDSASADLESIIINAKKLSDTFGSDYNENLSAVQTLMRDFGISSTEAFDLVTTGFQKGLNSSGDFLESITEYSTQFANGGADAGEFFSVLETGLQNGILGTDKAADMFKEFRVRIQDDSKTTKESLESIGIDPVKFAADLDSGKMSAVEAFQIILNKLKEVDDKGVQLRAGVGLMGTQFEDMGTQAALAVDTTTTKLQDMKGAIDNINPNESLTAKFEQAFRTISTTITTNSVWEAIENHFKTTFDDIKNSFEEAFQGVDFSEIEQTVKELINVISDTFADMDLDITSVEGMKNAIELVRDSINSLLNVSTGIADFFMPLIGFLKEAVEWFNSLNKDIQETIGFIVGLGASLTTLGGILGVGGILVGGLGNLAALFGSQGALRVGLAAFSTEFALLGNQISMFQATVALTIGWKVGGYIRELSGDAVDEWMQGIFKSIDSVINFTGQMGDVDLGEFGDRKLEIEIQAKTEKAKASLNEFFSGIDDFEVEVRADLKTEQSLDNFFGEVDKWEANYREVLLKAKADEKSIDNVKTEFIGIGKNPDGSWIYAEITAKGKDIDKVKKDIDTIPSEKLLEIKLQGEIDTQIAEIEAQAATAQEAFKYTAEVRIAEAQASAQVLEAAFLSVGQSVVSLSQSVSEMFGNLLNNWNDLGSLDQHKFMDILNDQQDAQNSLIDSQIAMNQAQIEFMQEKTRALSRGDGLIKIDSTGLEPALEMVMWEILEKVQIRASEEGASLLLGLPA